MQDRRNIFTIEIAINRYRFNANNKSELNIVVIQEWDNFMSFLFLNIEIGLK